MKTLSLDRILQSQGFGTRKGCRALIEGGEVAVDGTVVTRWQTEFQPEGLAFTVFGEPWAYRAHLYLALNKPPGYECSRKPSHHPGIHTLLPEQFTWREVQPVGRLDHDTTGLLLLSDDGDFIHAQSHPKRHQPKVYQATLAHPADAGLVQQLLDGVQLIDEKAPIAALAASLLDPLTIEIALDQGKYHQVKRMLAAAGNHCAALTRTRIGQLSLAELELAEGQWCHLDQAQLARLGQADTVG
ncbi:rRNA pseudouridine synthase [Chitiniphilus purpureus]|uniref:Pseudouridine synthase n=1 Tax=Chitiniphilus purpureus TaxID=2981137 RepID=A0ABY6DUZ3_9NEIS|nr:pseudouridine synthase [Chitiniphilus sp. CD1]UXY15688.1 rRNA pseudouridine synthase [Chitiniphilus sp. CD1]